MIGYSSRVYSDMILHIIQVFCKNGFNLYHYKNVDIGIGRINFNTFLID